MPASRLAPLAACAAALLAASCAPQPSGTPWANVREATPAFLASAAAADPSLAVESGGRVALDVLPDGRRLGAWVAGRTSAGLGGDDEPALAEIYASSSADGGVTWSPNSWVAGDVCSCCRIAMASSLQPDGSIAVAVAYRGAARDLRDPRVVVSRDGGERFVLDTLVSADRW